MSEEEKTDIVPIKANGRGLQLQSIEDMYRFAKYVVRSTLAPKSFQTPEQIIIAVQSGAELEMPPMRSLQSFCVINGSARLYGDAPLALVKQSGKMEYIKEWFDGEGEDMVAWCETKRKGEPEPVARGFSVDDAKTAGLWKKVGPWQTYPKRMLQMRARSLALRDVYPDCFGGATIAEEYEGIETPEPSHEADTPRREERKQVESEQVESNPIMENAILETFKKFIAKTGMDTSEEFADFAALALECDSDDLLDFNNNINPNSFDLDKLAKVRIAIDQFQPDEELDKTPPKEELPPYVCKRCGNTYKRKPKDMKCKCLGEVIENEPAATT